MVILVFLLLMVLLDQLQVDGLLVADKVVEIVVALVAALVVVEMVVVLQILVPMALQILELVEEDLDITP